MPELTVGVLALQGAFVEHIKLLRQAADELQARWVAAAGEEWEASQPRQGGVTDSASRSGGEDSQMPLDEAHQHEHAVGVKHASATVRTPRTGQPGPEVGAKSRPSTTADPLLIHISEVRTSYQLSQCAALVLPGGESTSISLIAARTGLLDPLRDFVKVKHRPVWGTCAGLILLAEEAVSASQGKDEGRGRGTELIGGLDVRVQRNYFGRQVESFEAELDLGSFLGRGEGSFHSVFIRAPVVEKVLVASKSETSVSQEVEILGRLPGRAKALRDKTVTAEDLGEEGDIVAVKQGNVFGTAFHPELTGDGRVHLWWLNEVVEEFLRKQKAE
ncbi:Senecionine N-oxygenase [Recurvomyces mirabilis]|nr:Senecionine N-oxygenase [Recurvomyces mirabilis]